MRAIPMFEKKAIEKGLSLLVTEANKSTEELGTSLLLCIVKDTRLRSETLRRLYYHRV